MRILLACTILMFSVPMLGQQVDKLIDEKLAGTTPFHQFATIYGGEFGSRVLELCKVDQESSILDMSETKDVYIYMVQTEKYSITVKLRKQVGILEFVRIYHLSMH